MRPSAAADTGVYPGPDDHMWIANVGADSIARIDPLAADPASTLEIHPAPPGGIHPREWRPGPDGRMWFSHRDPDRLLRIDLGASDWTQAIETVCGPKSVGAPDGLCGGPDGRLWFCNAGTSAIGRLETGAPDPAATLEFFTAPGLDTPYDLQDVGDFMAFTDKGGHVGRIAAGSPAL